VFALRYRTADSELLAVHNLAPSAVRARRLRADGLVDVLADRDNPAPTRRGLELDGHGFRWLRPPDAT
jgi:hypothetical protein